MASAQWQGEALELELSRTFRASREEVFTAWTTAEGLKRWSAPGEAQVAVAEVDLRVGGRYRIDMQGPDGTIYRVTGVYRLVDPPKKLVYTWRWDHAPDDPETLVTVDFLDRQPGTEIRLLHTGLASEESRKRHRDGWEGCLEKLVAMMGTPAPGRSVT